MRHPQFMQTGLILGPLVQGLLSQGRRGGLSALAIAGQQHGILAIGFADGFECFGQALSLSKAVSRPGKISQA